MARAVIRVTWAHKGAGNNARTREILTGSKTAPGGWPFHKVAWSLFEVPSAASGHQEPTMPELINTLRHLLDQFERPEGTDQGTHVQSVSLTLWNIPPGGNPEAEPDLPLVIPQDL